MDNFAVEVPAYMGEGADEDFLNLADVIFVLNHTATGTQLPVHGQKIARECKVGCFGWQCWAATDWLATLRQLVAHAGP
jgi:hypothetical protein